MSIKIGGKTVAVTLPTELYVPPVDSIGVNNMDLTITPTTYTQTHTPPLPYTGFGEITVSAVTSSIDTNITPYNIKSGVSILGVDGSYEGEQVNLTTLNVTANGTYNAVDDNFDGYSSVNVNVEYEPPVLTTLNVTANGTYNAVDDNVDGYSSITVNVAQLPSVDGNELVSQILNKNANAFALPSDVPVLKNEMFSNYENKLTIEASSTLSEIEPYSFSGSNVDVNYDGETLSYKYEKTKASSPYTIYNATDDMSYTTFQIDSTYLADKVSDVGNMYAGYNFQGTTLMLDGGMGTIEQTLVIPTDGTEVEFVLQMETYSSDQYSPEYRTTYLVSPSDIKTDCSVLMKGVLKYDTTISQTIIVSTDDSVTEIVSVNCSLPEYFTNNGWSCYLNSKTTPSANHTKLSLFTSHTITLYNKDYISQTLQTKKIDEGVSVALFPKKENGYKFEVVADTGDVVPTLKYDKASFTDTNYVTVRDGTVCKYIISKPGFTYIEGEKTVNSNLKLTCQMTPSEIESVVLSGDFVSPYTEELLSSTYPVVSNNELYFNGGSSTHSSINKYIKFVVPDDGNTHSISVTARTTAGGSYSGFVIACSKVKYSVGYLYFVVGYSSTPSGLLLRTTATTESTTYSVELQPGTNYLSLCTARYSNAAAQLYISNISFTSEKPYEGTITEELS